AARVAQAKARPAAARAETYRVRQGDTLWTIARRAGVSVAKLREANDLGSRSRLQPGQRLVIPAR
ncbi:MAG: LysM domain, partial [Gemmatimonadetes bacterium]|nr:LysM domain [Gemmatimonadota bacterium]